MFTNNESMIIHKLNMEIDKYKRSLNAIRAVVDSVENDDGINITVGNLDFDIANKTYDLSVLTGIIRSLTNSALGLKVPYPKWKGEE